MEDSCENPLCRPAEEEKIPAGDGERYLFRLYTAGPTLRSTRAIVHLRNLCEKHLPGRYEMEVVDLMENPARAAVDEVIAAPTLAKILPPPVRRFIGDLSKTERILKVLNLPSPSLVPFTVRS